MPTSSTCCVAGLLLVLGGVSACFDLNVLRGGRDSGVSDGSVDAATEPDMTRLVAVRSFSSGIAAAEGPSPIAFVQQNAGTLGSALAHTQAFIAPSTTGNLIVAAVNYFSTAITVVSVTDNKGNVYTQGIGPIDYSTSFRGYVYYAKNISGGGAPIAITATLNAPVGVEIYQSEYSGLDPTNPLDQAVGQGGTSVVSTSGTRTTTSANELIFGMGYGSSVMAPGVGFTARSTYNANVMEDKIVSAAGSYEALFDASGSPSWIAEMLTFRAATMVPALNLNVPADTLAGDVMLAAVAVRPETAMITAPADWTLVRAIGAGIGNGNEMAVYRKVATASEPASYRWSFARSQGAAGGIVSFAGVDTQMPIDVEAGAQTMSTLSHTAPGVITTVPNTMIVTVHAFPSAATWSPPSGMMKIFEVSSLTPDQTGGESMIVSHRAQDNAGPTGPLTAVASFDPDWGYGATIALRPYSALLSD